MPCAATTGGEHAAVRSRQMVNDDPVRDAGEPALAPLPAVPAPMTPVVPAVPPPPMTPSRTPGDAPDAASSGGPARPVRAGQLTLGWRAATAIVWGFVVVGFVAVWKTSRELGLSTWWLGPWGEPQPAYVTMLPFVAPIAMIVMAVNSTRRLPLIGLAAAAITALIATFDLSRVPRLAGVELAIAAAGALTAIAGFAGQYRAAPTPPVTSPDDD